MTLQHYDGLFATPRTPVWLVPVGVVSDHVSSHRVSLTLLAMQSVRSPSLAYRLS